LVVEVDPQGVLPWIARAPMHQYLVDTTMSSTGRSTGGPSAQVDTATTLSANNCGRCTIGADGSVTIAAAAGNVSLWLAPHGRFCIVTWAARTYHADGRSVEFVRPPGATAAVKGILFTPLQQLLPTAPLLSADDAAATTTSASFNAAIGVASSATTSGAFFSWAPAAAAWGPLVRAALAVQREELERRSSRLSDRPKGAVANNSREASRSGTTDEYVDDFEKSGDDDDGRADGAEARGVDLSKPVPAIESICVTGSVPETLPPKTDAVSRLPWVLSRPDCAVDLAAASPQQLHAAAATLHNPRGLPAVVWVAGSAAAFPIAAPHVGSPNRTTGAAADSANHGNIKATTTTTSGSSHVSTSSVPAIDAYVFEDGSAMRLTRMGPASTVEHLPGAFTSTTTPPAPVEGGDRDTTLATASSYQRDVASRAYLASGPLPSVVVMPHAPPSGLAAATRALVASVDVTLCDDRASGPIGTSGGNLTTMSFTTGGPAASQGGGMSARGRYLRRIAAWSASIFDCPTAAAAPTRLSARCPTTSVLAAASARGASGGSVDTTTTMAGMMPDGAVDASRVDGVGTFTALADGTVRCLFDDRTVMTLRPIWTAAAGGVGACGAVGDAAGAAAGGGGEAAFDYMVHALDARATPLTLRLASCAPTHPLYPHVQYAAMFIRYSRIPVTQRSALAQDLSVAADQHESYCQVVANDSQPIFSGGGGGGLEAFSRAISRRVAETELALSLSQSVAGTSQAMLR
jgi:hypothetical protein